MEKILEIANKYEAASVMYNPKSFALDNTDNTVADKYNKYLYKAVVKRGYDKPTDNIRMALV